VEISRLKKTLRRDMYLEGERNEKANEKLVELTDLFRQEMEDDMQYMTCSTWTAHYYLSVGSEMSQRSRPSRQAAKGAHLAWVGLAPKKKRAGVSTSVPIVGVENGIVPNHRARDEEKEILSDKRVVNEAEKLEMVAEITQTQLQAPLQAVNTGHGHTPDVEECDEDEKMESLPNETAINEAGSVDETCNCLRAEITQLEEKLQAARSALKRQQDEEKKNRRKGKAWWERRFNSLKVSCLDFYHYSACDVSNKFILKAHYPLFVVLVVSPFVSPSICFQSKANKKIADGNARIKELRTKLVRDAQICLL